MTDAIITVENLGKRYSLRHLRDQRYIAVPNACRTTDETLFFVS
jgi:hypothetical protein